MRKWLCLINGNCVEDGKWKYDKRQKNINAFACLKMHLFPFVCLSISCMNKLISFHSFRVHLVSTSRVETENTIIISVYEITFVIFFLNIFTKMLTLLLIYFGDFCCILRYLFCQWENSRNKLQKLCFLIFLFFVIITVAKI